MTRKPRRFNPTHRWRPIGDDEEHEVEIVPPRSIQVRADDGYTYFVHPAEITPMDEQP